MGKLQAVMEITRIEHSIMLIIAVVAAELLFGRLPALPILFLSIVTPVFVSMGAFAINDYFDVAADRMNRKARPLVRGVLSKKEALYITAICMIVGVAGSLLINIYCAVIALAFAFLSLLYSYRLKELPLVGNAYVAFSMSIPFIFGNYVMSSELSGAVIVIFAMVFISGLAREIDGTIRDYEGDVKVRNAITLPKAIGIRAAAISALILYLIAVAISAYMFSYVNPFAHNAVYLVLIAIVDIMLIYSGAVFAAGIKKKYDRVRNISLAGMALALVCILISVLVYIRIHF